MNQIVRLLRSVPDVVGSAVIASLLTLGGVFLSNRNHTKRLILQLEYDASEKAKERTAALRKEAYSEAVKELAKANSHLATLPQPDFAKGNFADGLMGFFGAAAKLQLVAEPNTA